MLEMHLIRYKNTKFCMGPKISDYLPKHQDYDSLWWVRRTEHAKSKKKLFFKKSYSFCYFKKGMQRVNPFWEKSKCMEKVKRRKEEEGIMPSLVATTSALARTTCVRMHSVCTNEQSLIHIHHLTIIFQSSHSHISGISQS